MGAWGTGGRGGSTRAHRTWRLKVLNRDNWTCQQCGRPANEADHILPYHLRPDLEHDPDNGQALCHQHHLDKTLQEATQARTLKQRQRPPRQHPGA